jgi:hypothetical protein
VVSHEIVVELHSLFDRHIEITDPSLDDTGRFDRKTFYARYIHGECLSCGAVMVDSEGDRVDVFEHERATGCASEGTWFPPS